VDNPMDTASVAQLTARLCEVEAGMAVLGKLGADLRAAITKRATSRWREDGAAPTYRVPNLGTVSLPIPQPKVVVDDMDAFASWCADHYPHQVTCVVTISDIAPDYLGETIDKAREIAPTDVVRGGVVPAPAFVKGLLDHATVAEGLALAAGSGDVIDGVKVIAGGDPAKADSPQPTNVSVRLDPQAKADAEAQATARLADVLAGGLVLTAGDLVDTSPVVDDATGEPDDDDPVCECRHVKTSHRGKTHGGTCTECEAADPTGGCRRFKAATSAWVTS
jgi:hypothetical protein